MADRIYTLADFDFNLPDDLIAQFPADKREGSRLMAVNRKENAVSHAMFNNIADFFHSGDVLVFNDAKVIHARIHCFRGSGGAVEVVLIEKKSEIEWKIISNRTARLSIGEKLHTVKDKGVSLEITGKKEGVLLIKSNCPLTPSLLETIGEVPLPPYIKRKSTTTDSERYQTVYAKTTGAVAAPTAGLHFTRDLLDSIEGMGVSIVLCTLFVSWGTFQPVRDNDLSKHLMHSEKYLLSPEAAEIINAARGEGRRIIAVGTTSLRVLESTLDGIRNVPGHGETDIFIYPPKEVKSIDALITNFHTPHSTLLMLVCAFGGYDLMMKSYREAVEQRYRFFSYGDSMIIC
jgi:S-adenosylmethionine:tRNA ribosyltransferase-isomerase